MQDSQKIVYISVVSDLFTDQRVHRTSLSLSRQGLKVTLIGRKLKSSPAMQEREYAVHRFRLMFERGPLFYISYNLNLFFFLLFKRMDVLVANDLDTLFANYLISIIRRKPLYYDSHEYFTGVPELVERPFIRSCWKTIERFILPRIKNMFTVNESIADLYRTEYNIKCSVVRNLPLRNKTGLHKKSRHDLGIPEDKHILLFQGAGINVQRGAEEILEAMQYLDNFLLVFIGGGDVVEHLKKESISLNLTDKVFFFPRMSMEELRTYTAIADLGLSLDKDTNINYRFSLPNKIFDYIQAGVPVLASDLPEVRKIISTYDVGELISTHDPIRIAAIINEIFQNKLQLARWRENLKYASEELCWEKEEATLLEVFKDVIE